MFLPDDSIPKPLYDALIASDDGYSTEVKEYLRTHGRDINLSVTSLNKPVQSLILTKRHWNEIMIRPLDDLWHSFMGQVIHWVLEKYASNDPNYYTEFRQGVTFEYGKKEVHIHGMLDLYNRKEKGIEDWKLTSGNSMMYPKTSYENQLNLLGYIMQENGYEVNSLRNIYLFPHLDKTMFQKPDYPRRHAKVVNVPMERRSVIEDRIFRKIKSYTKSLDKMDKDLPLCTDEDRWVRGSVFKGYTRKKGGKKGVIQPFTSTAKISSEDRNELIKFQLTENLSNEDFKVVEFKGEPKYCHYCPAAAFCHQHQAYLKSVHAL